MKLQTLLDSIPPADTEAYDACITRFNGIAKPLGSLGRLETLLARAAAVQRSANMDITRKCVLVFCADNGVTAQGVTQSDSSVTAMIARMMLEGRSGVCAMARACGADVYPLDIGMQTDVEGMASKKLMYGTFDITKGAAMPRETAIATIETGIGLVKEKKAQGYTLLASGEAGIGNTTTAAAVTAALLNKTPEEVAGRGAGLCDDGLLRKRRAIAAALKLNRPDPADAVDVLCKVGGLDIAGMCGEFIGGAAYGVPIVADGVISLAAALCAVRLCPRVKDCILPSHLSAEPAGRLLLNALGFEPVLSAGMRLGEGTGAVALFALLDLAAAVYYNAATFEDIALRAYSKQC